jgi:hypothetical protein
MWLFRKRLRSLSGPEECLGALMAGGGCCCAGHISEDGVDTGAFGTMVELDRKWMERLRELKPSLEVMVGCSIVGEVG